MKISNLKSSLIAATIFGALNISSAADYYYYSIGGYSPMAPLDERWSLSKDESIIPTTLPASGDNVIIYSGGKNGTFSRGDINFEATWNSFTSTYNTELNSLRVLTLVSDFNMNVDSASAYNNTISVKTLRFAVQVANFLNIGGDMNLETSKYFTTRFSLLNALSPVLRVNGALNFIHNDATAAGYHTFDMSDVVATSTGKNFTINAGGLSSTGKTVFMTSYNGITANYNFLDNDSSVFTGGDFKGVFATSGAATTANFSMNGSGKQSITIYKAANTAAHGLTDLAAKTDMTIGSVSVSSGEFDFNTELAVNSLTLSGGKLKFSSTEKVASFTIDAGSLIFGGEIKTDDFTVAAVDIVKIILSAEDLQSNELSIVSYDYIDVTEDVNDIFAAYDINGNKLGGKFSLTSDTGAGSLIYTVPEPSTIALVFGLLALAGVVARRRK